MAGKAVGEHFQFFAEAGRRGGLPVCFGEHGDVAPFFGKLFEFGTEAVDNGVVNVVDGIAEGAGHSGIVDVL